ncbi:TonB-dependent receptor domain-containing protein [Terrimonas sp.]|uniref:TonB-dependent receptor domain-containing protein n=1 Tax=Terrimonas sp. TaxID=1914338 RepID=UPI001F0BA1CC|nr:TonB-dependent receptor [Terrimonas sp.]
MKQLNKYILTGIALSFLMQEAFTQTNTLVTASFHVSGNCEMCKGRIEQSALSFKSITYADWNIKTGGLQITFDSALISKAVIQQKIAEAGHDNDSFKASDETYKSLPVCCHYHRSGKGGIKNVLHRLSGVIVEETVKGKLQPVAGATIKSLHSGESFITDSTGVFQFQATLPAPVIISYTEFAPDTITLTNTDFLTVTLKNASSVNLKAVTINSKKEPAYLSLKNVYNTLNLGAAELSKAACCNLSESFETSPSVDVSYSDAITGIKQIQLLGLSGIYTQLLTENVPELKGLQGSYGLTFIPGTWIESIQVTKGVGSVVNGYESIAGQINIEEKKPDNTERLLVNSYVNSMGRAEQNINLAHRLNNKWSTAVLAHADAVAWKHDGNHDGFVDIPGGRQFNLISRWKYADNNGWIGQFAIKALNDKRYAGQRGSHHNADTSITDHYTVDISSEQYTVTGKLGYVFPQHKYKSVGVIFSGNIYNNESVYGINTYSGKQKNIYANFIYQSIIGTTMHKYRTGFSFSNENYREIYIADHSEHSGDTDVPGHTHVTPGSTGEKAVFTRNEIVPGAFFEYTYTAPFNLSVIAGIRADHHNYFGWITTPRLNLKYDFSEKTNLRVSAGSGYRLANIFTENAAAFVSSRQYRIINTSHNYGYGLDPEKAWTVGVNFLHAFKLHQRAGTVSVDAYRTSFINQIVVDFDAHPQELNFYNLEGKSYSNNIQVELNYELLKKLDVRLAYKWLDVKTAYWGELLQKPLLSKHRAFINLEYKISDKWKFDYTTQWYGRKRIPYTVSNPEGLRLSDYSPAFIQITAQVTRKFESKWELYAGGENLTGYRQNNPILDAANPFGKYFDGSLVWGPITGRMIYVGGRFIL